LAPLPGDAWSIASAVSADGATVVGQSGPTGSYQTRGFRWTAAEGAIDLGRIDPDTEVEPLAVSNDGAVVLGSWYGGSPWVSRAFVWSAAAGLTALQPFPGDLHTRAVAMSADGAIVFGISSISVGGVSATDQAFWGTSAGGVQALAPLPGDAGTNVVGVDASGKIAVGVSLRNVDTGDGGSFVKRVGVLWVDGGAAQALDVVLPQLGGDISPLVAGSLQPIAISADGHTVLGQGSDASSLMQGWIASIP
jgi:uncharacterized membrane protein